MQVIDFPRQAIRALMRRIAQGLQHVTHGRLHPNVVTITSLLAHVPIAYLIATRHYAWAAVLLVIFGLFDTLDGELARVQQRASVQGMLLDAATDRMKETILYTSIAYALALSGHPANAAWAAAACGASICVSYVKAKGEAAVASGAMAIPHAKLNRMFKDGLLTFETRIALLILGLLLNQLVIVTASIAILASFTALQRLVGISKQLTHVRN